MITTIAEFIEELKSKALVTIGERDSDITHRPTIGNIFEGLTSEILSKAIFDGLNLRVVQNSFIYNDSGHLSPEMDCMIVIGYGLKISYTNQFKYHIKDVIAVVQVKKTLYGEEIDSSYQNLKSVLKVSEPRDGEMYMTQLQRDAYKLFLSKELPNRRDLSLLSDREQIIYHFLLMEAFHPIRIVIGYFGYQDEYSFREGFVKNLEKKIVGLPIKDYSPGSFPHLIICGDSSILKTNGMPFGLPFIEHDYYWPVLMSANNKPFYFLLELIWTRLSYKFGISSMIFGDDFEEQALHPLLICKHKKIEKNLWGWEYLYSPISKLDLEKPMSRRPWQPVELAPYEFVLLDLLNKEGVIDLCSENITRIISQYEINQQTLLFNLVKRRIIYQDKGQIRLLVEKLLMSTIRGVWYAGENKNGEMLRFISKNI